MPAIGTGAVTATVTALDPKGLRARMRKVKPRNLAIAGAVAASVLAAAAVAGFLLLGPKGDQDRPAEYAFDSDAVHSITDSLDSSVSPQDTNAPGDPNALWNYDVAPATPDGSSGTSTYTPPYRSGTSSRFIPYTPPYGSYGQSDPSGQPGSGGNNTGTGGPVPQAMPAGSYSYGGAGTVPAGFWSNSVSVPGTVAATVTPGDAGCSTLTLGAGGNTVSSTYCVSGGALSAGPRTRTVQNGRLTMTCSGPLLPAGAQSAGATKVDCKASAGALSEDLSGTASVVDAGGAWVATTDVSAASGDHWTEHVTIDKASGRVALLQSDVRIALLVYQESSQFTLR